MRIAVQSRRTSLAVLVAAAVLPVFLAGAGAVWVLIERQRVMLADDMRNTAQALLAAVDGEVQNQLILAQTLAASPALDDGELKRFDLIARRLIAENRSWLTVVLNAPDGQQLVNTLKPFGEPLPVSSDPTAVRHTVATRRPVIGELMRQGNYIDEPFLIVRVPAVRNDAVPYVVSVAVRPDRFQAIVQGIGDQEGGFGAVWDPRKVVVARTNRPDFVGLALPATLTSHSELLGKTTFSAAGIDGKEYIHLAMQSETTGWWAVVGKNRGAFLAPLWRSVAQVAAIGSVAALLSIGAAAWLGRRIRDEARREEAQRMTIMRAATKELEKALATAEAADAAKSRFLAAASHDLRQPMQAMRLYHHVLLGRNLDDKARSALGGLGQAMDGAEELLAALLDLSSLEAGTVRPRPSSFAIAEMIAEVVAEYRAVAAENSLSLRARSIEAAVYSDRVLLKRMLRNLVHNAVRYTEQGVILIAARRRGDMIALQVWDSGRGIPPDKLDAIFEDFYQLDNPARDRSRGLGLGLAIVQRTARLLGLHVNVRSRVGQGSRFEILVPIAAVAALPAKRQPV